MKMIVAVALALVAVAAAKPVEDKVDKIIRSEYEQQPEGGYSSNYETENGIRSETEGKLKTVPDEDNKPQIVLVVRGQYSYPGDDGKLISIIYEADENGYRAQGDSIPRVASRR